MTHCKGYALFRIPKGFDVNSRGCNPRNARSQRQPALKGPNHPSAIEFDPFGGGWFFGVRPPGFTRSYLCFAPSGRLCAFASLLFVTTAGFRP